jgi:hypothetical protein
MTRKEAQQIINSWLASSKAPKGQLGYIEGWFDDDDVEAFRMAIETLQDKPKDEWIPCSERLPSEERHYLCCNTGYLPFIAHYHDGQWHCFDETTSHVDAWMPLPKSYREDSK